MTLNSRMKKLETNFSKNVLELPILIVSYVGIDGSSRPAWAIHPGTFSIHRSEEEEEGEFLQRVYTEYVEAKGLAGADPQTLSDNDLQILIASRDAASASEFHSAGSIGDDRLSRITQVSILAKTSIVT